MRITMENGVEVEKFKISWARVAAICFAAGGLYVLVQSNTDDIKLLRSDLSTVITSQVTSNDKLNTSIANLNGTLIRLEESLRNREDDVKELQKVVQEHDRKIIGLKSTVDTLVN